MLLILLSLFVLCFSSLDGLEHHSPTLFALGRFQIEREVAVSCCVANFLVLIIRVFCDRFVSRPRPILDSVRGPNNIVAHGL